MQSLQVYVYDSPQQWTSEFVHCAYTRPHRQNLIIIHCLCHATKAARIPHGNSTRNTRAHIRTQSRVLVRNAGAPDTASTQRVYQHLIANGSSLSAPATGVPRNTEQIQNTLTVQQ